MQSVVGSKCWIPVKSATACRVGGVTRSCPYPQPGVIGFRHVTGGAMAVFERINTSFP